MNLIVLSPLLKSLAALNPAAFEVSAETIARYRRLCGIPNQQYVSQHKAQLLIAALLFRPRSERELALMWGANREAISRWLAKAIAGMDLASVQITQSVRGGDLAAAIFEVSLISIRSTDTLENYARELSNRSGQQIKFHSDLVYGPELATAFARLAVEKRESRKQSGLRTAFQRWGYVPDVQFA